MEVVPDSKNGGRIRDPELLRQAHWAFDECAICGAIDITVHHILSRSLGGDDVWANLAPLCGSGTHGCHGGVEANSDLLCASLGLYVTRERPDTVEYLSEKLGSPQAAAEWLRRHLRVRSVPG